MAGTGATNDTTAAGAMYSTTGASVGITARASAMYSTTGAGAAHPAGADATDHTADTRPQALARHVFAHIGIDGISSNKIAQIPAETIVAEISLDVVIHIFAHLSNLKNR